MPRELLCAVDVGTGSARAGLFDHDGTMLARAATPFPVWLGDGLRAEHPSEDIWQAVGQAVRAALAEAGAAPGDVAALGFDATCSLVLRDPAGAPLRVDRHDTIAWFDHRAIEEAGDCDRTGHPALAHLGGAMSPEMQLPKLMWLKRHRPDLWTRLGHAFDLADFLTWRATGGTTRSACTVTAKWSYLAHAGGWPTDFLAALGLGGLGAAAGIGGRIAPVGEAVGRLTEKAATELGLVAGVPVAAGMVDAFAGALGALAGIARGQPAMALIAGTSTCVMSVADTPWRAPGVWGPFLSCVMPDRWVCEGGQSASGAVLDEVLRMYGLDATPGMHERVGRHIASALDREGMEYGAGLHVLPDFNGNRTPLADPFARGVIVGLSLDRSFDAACRLYWRTAVGLALGIRQVIEHMERHGAPRPETLAIAGGHGRSGLLTQLYADATGRPVVCGTEADAMLLGSAIAAAAALDPAPGGLEAAALRMGRTAGRYEPAGSRRQPLDRDYEIFLRLQMQRAEIGAMETWN